MAVNITNGPDVCLHAEKISKIYPGTKALDQVSFNVYKGKVNVLIGENGAGKSTLMKIIAGIEQESEGELFMGEEKVHFDDVTEARNHGIGIIHQELNLFPNLAVNFCQPSQSSSSKPSSIEMIGYLSQSAAQ